MVFLGQVEFQPMVGVGTQKSTTLQKGESLLT